MLFVAEVYWDLEWTVQQQGFRVPVIGDLPR
jgi:hypothetical protein